MKTILIIILMLTLGSTAIFAQDKPAGPSGCRRAETIEYGDWLEDFAALFQAFIEAPQGADSNIAWDRFITSLTEHMNYMHSECAMIREGYLEFVAWYGVTSAGVLADENRASAYESILINGLLPELWLSLDWRISNTIGRNPA